MSGDREDEVVAAAISGERSEGHLRCGGCSSQQVSLSQSSKRFNLELSAFEVI